MTHNSFGNEESLVRVVVDLVRMMSDVYGGTVYDLETGESLDWGQAFCRDAFGVDWRNVCQDDKNDPIWVLERMVDSARAWSTGEWPAWASEPGEES